MKSACGAANKRATATLAAVALSLAAVTIATTAAAQNGRAPQAQPAAPVFAGSCVTTATKAKVSTLLQQAQSATYTDVAETKIAFTQGGASASCVIVSFSAEAAAAANTILVVQAVLDGTPCQPAGVSFVQANANVAANAMNYVCANVAPGNHAVKMQFKSNSAGYGVVLGPRTMIVHYAK
jgi:hypothetical protein